jgi:hypothetical protein
VAIYPLPATKSSAGNAGRQGGKKTPETLTFAAKPAGLLEKPKKSIE